MFMGWVVAGSLAAQEAPDPWAFVERYQGTITRAEFDDRLHRLFDPFGGLRSSLQYSENAVTFQPAGTETPLFRLEFAPDVASSKVAPRSWRTPEEIRRAEPVEGRPLAGLRVVLDPGHIGGEWGRIEQRSTLYPGFGRVQEGDLNLITAALLKTRLEALGAEVFPTRTTAEPTTSVRPEDLLDEALAELREKRPDFFRMRPGETAESRDRRVRNRVRYEAEFVLFRRAEILARSAKVRAAFQPDLTVVLFFNASPRSIDGRTTPENRNTFFVHGSYLREEALWPRQQPRLFYKLLDRATPTEFEVARSIATVFREKTGLEPVRYGDSATTRRIEPGYDDVVARNIAANREHDGPVVVVEPYFMNHPSVLRRLLAGDFDGEREFEGRMMGSIFREYAECVVEGLVRVYGR
jgi:N-acetylmuramoyl-L-alanine amidase